MYGSDIRRELHMHPELGFDLPYTTGVVRRELTKLGIPFTEKYGKSSITAYLNGDRSGKYIAIRADMDALPITEMNGVPYRSLNEGHMHACGHDVHTAILLDTARKLLPLTNRIARPVKLIFQAAEEYSAGAKLMVEDGVLDDVEEALSVHVNPSEVGSVQFIYGAANSACASLTLRFLGKGVHSSMQENGADAILMAANALNSIESYFSKRVPAEVPLIFNAGKIEGGSAGNIIADRCTVTCHIRSWNDEILEKALGDIREIAQSSARIFGGSAVMEDVILTPTMMHEKQVTDRLRSAAEQVLGPKQITVISRVMSSEDFAFFSQKVPACMLCLSAGNKERGITSPVHTNTFDVDERCIDLGSDIFVRYLLDRE